MTVGHKKRNQFNWKIQAFIFVFVGVRSTLALFASVGAESSWRTNGMYHKFNFTPLFTKLYAELLAGDTK